MTVFCAKWEEKIKEILDADRIDDAYYGVLDEHRYCLIPDYDAVIFGLCEVERVQEIPMPREISDLIAMMVAEDADGADLNGILKRYEECCDRGGIF